MKLSQAAWQDLTLVVFILKIGIYNNMQLVLLDNLLHCFVFESNFQPTAAIYSFPSVCLLVCFLCFEFQTRIQIFLNSAGNALNL